MEQVTNTVGNPTTLLLERFFWLGLGGFLGLSILTSLVRGLKEKKNEKTSVAQYELEKLAKKAINKNSDSN